MKEKTLKNLLFVGSGATAALGFKTTENLGKAPARRVDRDYPGTG